MAGVPREILERMDALGDQVLDMFESGSSSADAAAMLEQLADVAEVEWDDEAIRFRVLHGRSTWIYRESIFAAWDVPDGAPRPFRATSPGPERVVVSKNEAEKEGLVLSPFFWQVPTMEDGAAVSEILENTRGYEGRVAFRENRAKDSTKVDLATFSGWEGYEVVHISTHGKRLCDGGGCRATLVAGIVESALPGQEPWEQLLTFNQKGVDYVKGEKTGLEYVVLTADFFRNEYPNGLDDALIFLNACQSFGPQATDIVDALQGANSVVFGWSETVSVVDATAAALALYEELSEGYPAKIALSNIGGLKVGDAAGDHPAPELRLSERREGGDLRIREVVELLHPSSGELLSSTDKIAVEGTPEDGEPDAVPWAVRVDGVKEEFAGDVTVHVTIDGIAADPIVLSDGDANDDDQWTVSGVLPLPYDLEEDKIVTLEAKAELHDEGESDDQEVATLTGEDPTMGTIWEMEASHTIDYEGQPFVHTPVTASAALILTREEGQAPDESHPRFIITGGTVTYDYNHTSGECTYSAPIVMFDVIHEEHSPVAYLEFDTTVEPVQYTGYLNTYGPVFQYTASCGDSEGNTYDKRANPVWLNAQFDPRPVSADRQLIEDTYELRQFFDLSGGYWYVHRTEYTIRRIE